MEDKPKPAVDTPAPVTDQAPEESPIQVQAATAEQGAGSAAEEIKSDTADAVERQVDSVPTGEATETAHSDPEAGAAGEGDEGPAEDHDESLSVETTEAAASEDDTGQDQDAAAAAPEAAPEAGAAEPSDATEPPSLQEETVTEEPAPQRDEPGAPAPVAMHDKVPTAAEADEAQPVAQTPQPGDPVGPAATTPAEPVEAGPPPQAGDAAPAAVAGAAAAAPDDITMEDVLAASDQQLASKPVHRGMITTGEIIMLSQDGIVVDVAAKIEGILPYNQLFEYESNPADAAKYFKPGDKIQVYVVRSDIPNNTIVLSKRRADQERAWNLLQEIYDKQKPVEVEIVEKVKGGLVANLGIRAFLPASQVDIRRVNDLSPYVDKRLRVKIIELNRKRNRVIISRRAILEDEVAELKAETLKKLEPGLKIEGEVVEITDFGAFVNLGGIDGLVHRSELSHGRFGHPRDVVQGRVRRSTSRCSTWTSSASASTCR